MKPRVKSRRTGQLAETVLGYAVRYSTRAKRLQIRVRPWVGVEVVAPQRCSARRIENFVRAQREWIENTAKSLPPAPPPDSLPCVIALPAVGRTWHVRYGARLGARLFDSAGYLLLHAAAGDPAAARRDLRAWLAATARAVLVPRLDGLAARHGFHYNKVTIRGQRTRWGSCSARKHLSINYKLLFLAPELVDYLLVHELAHTRHLNHSPRFWGVVEACMPDYRELESRMNRAWQDVPGWVEAR